MSNKRIDLTQFEREQICPKISDYIRGDDYPDEIPLRIMGLYSDLIAELKRCYEKEDETIEYVDYLLATPDVLERLMGSPSQIHTINNLTASLEKLLDILKN